MKNIKHYAVILFFLFSTPLFANFELDLNRGVASFLNKDYAAAIEIFQQALSQQPDNITANHLIGISYLRLHDYKNAAEYLEKAKSLDPGIENIELDLGNAYIKLGMFEEANALLEQFISKNPDNGTGFYYLGYSQLLSGNYNEAIASLEKAVALNPELALQSNYYQGVAYYSLFKYSMARERLLEVQRISPQSRLGISAQEYLNVLRMLGKNYYATVSVGYQYDSNVGIQPNDFKIFSDRGDSSIYLFANLGYKPYFTDDAVIGLDYRTFFNFHDKLDEFNIQNHNFSVYGEKDLKSINTPTRLFLDYTYQFVLIDGSPASDLFSQSHIVVPGATIRWSSTVTSRVFYRFRYDDFEDFPERDAYNNSITWAQFYRMGNGRVVISPGIKLELNSTDDIPNERNWTYWSPEIFIEAASTFKYDISVYSRIHYFHQNYYDDDFDRKDNQFGLKLLIDKRLYRHLYLDLAYDFIYNGSNSNFPGPEPFEFNRNVFTVGLTVKY